MPNLINWIKKALGIDLNPFADWLKANLGLELSDFFLVGIIVLLGLELVILIVRRSKKNKWISG